MNLVRVPAFVDLHVHFREPGFPEKETIASGARAAASGGYRAVCMMPNTKPAIDCPEVLRDVDRIGRETGVCILAASAMTKGQDGTQLVDLESMDTADTVGKNLIGHGVCGVSEDGKTLDNAVFMEEICREAKCLGIPVMDHAEPEVETVSRDVALARRTGARVHIQHVSLAESVQLIRAAKAEGAPVSCETAPHYIALTKDALHTLGADAKMNPPLAQERDRHALIEGLCDGTIDCIATDHAPHEPSAKYGPFMGAPNDPLSDHAPHEPSAKYGPFIGAPNDPLADHAPHEASAKTGSLDLAANGIIGLETAFPVAYTILVKGGYMTLDDLVKLMSINPSNIIGLPQSADSYVDLDLDTEYQIDRSTFRSMGRNTPFHGMTVYGRIVQTVINGRVVYSC